MEMQVGHESRPEPFIQPRNILPAGHNEPTARLTCRKRPDQLLDDHRACLRGDVDPAAACPRAFLVTFCGGSRQKLPQGVPAEHAPHPGSARLDDTRLVGTGARGETRGENQRRPGGGDKLEVLLTEPGVFVSARVIPIQHADIVEHISGDAGADRDLRGHPVKGLPRDIQGGHRPRRCIVERPVLSIRLQAHKALVRTEGLDTAADETR